MRLSPPCRHIVNPNFWLGCVTRPEEKLWTVRTVLRWTTDWFRKKYHIDTARLDAELLLADALGCRRLDLFLDPGRPLTPSERTAFKIRIQRRAAREPVALIVGHREFWSLNLKVRHGVLIPRPETETLVEAVCHRLSNKFSDKNIPLKIADIGVGSGAVLLSLLTEYPSFTGIGVDISQEALACCAENIQTLGFDARARCYRSDLFSSLNADHVNLDLIVSNPPYLSESEITDLEPEIGQWEPRSTWYGGKDGLAIYEKLIPKAQDYLKPNGLLAVEIGAGQSASVTTIMHTANFKNVETVLDYGKRPRVVLGEST